MGMIEINRNPSQKELRWFGMLFAAFFGIVGAIAYFRFGAPRAGWTIWIAAGAIVVVYYLAPPLRRLIYLGWMYATMPIGWVITHVLLAIVFYLVLTPIGLARRSFWGDPLLRRFDRKITTYWSEHRPGEDPSRYFRQF